MFTLSGAKIAVAGPRSRNALVSARTDWAIGFGEWDQKVYANVAQVLPLRPLWPGFAINTVFYAGVLWLLFAAPFALRRRRRIKRGLCPKCAYPVGASDVCTECGATVTVRLSSS